MYHNVSKTIQIHLNVSKCILMYLKVFRCIKMLFETHTAQDFDEYMEVFDKTMITLKINSSDATKIVDDFTGSQRAKAALISSGGPILLKSIRNFDDYKTKTYALVRTELEAEYVGVTPLQALSRFNRCKPTQSDLFTDYVKRLKL